MADGNDGTSGQGAGEGAQGNQGAQAGQGGDQQQGQQGAAGASGTGQQGAQGADGKQGQGQQQTQVADWRASIQDEKLREHAGRFTSLDDLVRGNLDQRQKLSSAIVKPGKDAKPEEVAAYRKAVGIPDTAEAYRFPDLPEGQQITDEIKADRADWAKEFHEAGLTTDQAERLVNKMAGKIAAQQVAQVEADKRFATEQTEALKKEWAGAEYDRNVTFAKRAFDTLAEKAGVTAAELKQIETKSGQFLMDDARMLRIFAALGREMGEGNLGPVVTAEQKAGMESELRQVRADIEKAQANRDPAEANRLYQREQQIIARMQGSQPIVGAQGRAA